MKDIILITGAGASHDVHKVFGLGRHLMQQIIERVSSQEEFIRYFIDTEGLQESTLLTFINNLVYYKEDAEFKSIDEFLTEVATFPEYKQLRKDYLNIGKAAILFHITGWEGFFKTQYKAGEVDIKNTWIHEIIKFIESHNLLDAYVNTHKVKDSLQILTFNYDRLLEFCILEHFGDSTKVRSWIHHNIIHIYDTLMLNDMLKDDGLCFGYSNDNIAGLLSYKDKIKTMYDNRGFELNRSVIKSTGQTLGYKDFQQRIFTSQEKIKIACFGFGFDYFNCRNLGILESDIHANIITEENGAGSFKNRRNLTNKVRTMIKDSSFYYLPCKEFVHYVLNNLQ